VNSSGASFILPTIDFDDDVDGIICPVVKSPSIRRHCNVDESNSNVRQCGKNLTQIAAHFFNDEIVIVSSN
jgi:hypothetical protein